MASIYAEVTDRTLHTPFATIVGCMQPEHFVAIRNVPGGCGPEAMRDMFARAEEAQARRERWLQQRQRAEADSLEKQQAGLQAIVKNSEG